MSGISATEKRHEVIDFSVPYSNSGQTFATMKDSPLAKLPDTGMRFSLIKDEAGAIKELDKIKPTLQDKVIGVQTVSVAASFLNKYLQGVVKVREYKTTEERDLDLAAGRVDLVIASVRDLFERRPRKTRQRQYGLGRAAIYRRFAGQRIGYRPRAGSHFLNELPYQ